MNIISVKDAVFSYDGTRNHVDGVSFDIEAGSYTTIVGHNGSGKSTMAKLIDGLLELKSGEIFVDGLKLDLEHLYEIRSRIGIVFQNPDNQFIGSTIRDDIAFGLENHQVKSEEMDALIEEYSRKVGLFDLLDKEPQNLSGGQKQRVAIAGAMAMRPKIIIFDEATSMLDPKGKRDVKRLMAELNDDNRFTILSITHDIEVVLQSDYCLVMNKGKVYMHDTPDEIFKHGAELKKIGLDIPFIAQVKEEFRKQGIKLKKNDLEGVAEELWQLNSNH